MIRELSTNYLIFTIRLLFELDNSPACPLFKEVKERIESGKVFCYQERFSWFDRCLYRIILPKKTNGAAPKAAKQSSVPYT